VWSRKYLYFNLDVNKDTVSQVILLALKGVNQALILVNNMAE